MQIECDSFNEMSLILGETLVNVGYLKHITTERFTLQKWKLKDLKDEAYPTQFDSNLYMINCLGVYGNVWPKDFDLHQQCVMF